MSEEPALHVTMPARLDKVSWLTDVLRSATTGTLQDEDFILFEIGVVELINNIIEHSFHEGPGTLDVTCALEGPHVTLLISDGGAAMPDGFQDMLDALDGEVSLDAESGRGLRIIKQCFNKVLFYRQDGLNKVKVTYLAGSMPELVTI